MAVGMARKIQEMVEQMRREGLIKEQKQEQRTKTGVAVNGEEDAAELEKDEGGKTWDVGAKKSELKENMHKKNKEQEDIEEGNKGEYETDAEYDYNTEGNEK